jgi:hypothetical protein
MHTRYQFGLGRADRASQVILGQSFGVGFPHGLEAGLALPFGWTVGSREASRPDVSSRPLAPRPLKGMGEEGPAVGDLKLALFWSAIDAGDGGLGLLVGLVGGVPTGMHERLMGEGGFTLEPLVSMAFQVFGSRIALNIVYRWRPEHVSVVEERPFEQDDDVVWRVGLRIPRKNDVAWAIEAEGAVGVLTGQEGFPGTKHRPVVIGAGLDFPLSRLFRLGINTAFGVTGEAAPRYTFGVSLWWLPVLPDEDKDGLMGMTDNCPLLKEDHDGFEDDDGCPDLDNDKDGFPDEEDACPSEPADDFSEDGCLSE